MCGIAGIVGEVASREALSRMGASLHHRGPDGLGIYRDADAALVHTRLAIIDVAAGHQPMVDAASRAWLVFNGELFNHVELREALEAEGCTFRTRSDTEVLLQAWLTWGEAALGRFEGQWAFALWSPTERRLVLCRDRVGIRPLFYARQGRALYFASEIKALFAASPSLSQGFSAEGLDECLTFWSPLAPNTAFQGVFELEPGHLAVFEDGQLSCRPYVVYPPEVPASELSFEEAVAQVEAALYQATALRTLRSDVPVGCYVSGGLDSALIATLSQVVRERPMHTFSIRFEDQGYDESDAQQALAQALGSHHHERTVTRAEVVDHLPAVVRAVERPLLRTAPVPLYLLAQSVRAAGLKVVLSGEGADEIFAGYDLFKEGAIRRFWARQPTSTLRPMLLARLYPYLGGNSRSPLARPELARAFFGQDLGGASQLGFAHALRWKTTAALKRLLRPEWRVQEEAPGPLLSALASTLEGRSALAQDQSLEVRTLLSPYLLAAQGDRVSLAHGVEGRMPFLAWPVICLAASLPDTYKLRALQDKRVLRALGARHLPAAISRRPKQPYRAPAALALAGPGRPAWVDERLSPEALTAVGVISPDAFTPLWRKLKGKPEGPFSHTEDQALVFALSVQLLAQGGASSAPSVEARWYGSNAE